MTSTFDIDLKYNKLTNKIGYSKYTQGNIYLTQNLCQRSRSNEKFNCQGQGHRVLNLVWSHFAILSGALAFPMFGYLPKKHTFQFEVKVKVTTFEVFLGIIGLHSSRLTRRQVEIILLLQNLCYTEIALNQIQVFNKVPDESCYKKVLLFY